MLRVEKCLYADWLLHKSFWPRLEFSIHLFLENNLEDNWKFYWNFENKFEANKVRKEIQINYFWRLKSAYGASHKSEFSSGGFTGKRLGNEFFF